MLRGVAVGSIKVVCVLGYSVYVDVLGSNGGVLCLLYNAGGVAVLCMLGMLCVLRVVCDRWTAKLSHAWLVTPWLGTLLLQPKSQLLLLLVTAQLPTTPPPRMKEMQQLALNLFPL